MTAISTDSYVEAIAQGIPFRDFSITDIVRYLLSYLLFLYLFSLGVDFKDGYSWLVVTRMKNANQWENSVLIFGILLSVIYWGGIALTLGFKTRTLLFLLLSTLSSISLVNLFVLIKKIIRENNLSFIFIALILLIYIFTFFITGEMTVLFLNTSVISLSRLNTTINLNNSFLGLITQNLIVLIINKILINKKGLE